MYLCQAQQIIEISDSNVITHEKALLSIESACPRRPFSKNRSFITRPDPDLSRFFGTRALLSRCLLFRSILQTERLQTEKVIS